jgi:hypothetical protein
MAIQAVGLLLGHNINKISYGLLTKPEMTELTVYVHCILYYKLYTIHIVHIPVYKVSFTLLQAMKAQRGVGV